MLGNYRVASQLVASPVVLSLIDLVSYENVFDYNYSVETLEHNVCLPRYCSVKPLCEYAVRYYSLILGIERRSVPRELRHQTRNAACIIFQCLIIYEWPRAL
jgi:hypothetical protein